MKDLEKMLMGKKPDDSKMSKEAIQAKMEMLQELMDSCQDEMGKRTKSGMDEMQKITVAAPDKKSLAAGLEKAQEITEELPMEESDEHEKEETPSEEEAEQTLSQMMMDDSDDDSIFAKRK